MKFVDFSKIKRIGTTITGSVLIYLGLMRLITFSVELIDCIKFHDLFSELLLYAVPMLWLIIGGILICDRELFNYNRILPFLMKFVPILCFVSFIASSDRLEILGLSYIQSDIFIYYVPMLVISVMPSLLFVLSGILSIYKNLKRDKNNKRHWGQIICGGLACLAGTAVLLYYIFYTNVFNKEIYYEELYYTEKSVVNSSVFVIGICIIIGYIICFTLKKFKYEKLFTQPREEIKKYKVVYAKNSELYRKYRAEQKRIVYSSRKENNNCNVCEDEKICPMCAEKIKKQAIICRYCGYQFNEVIGTKNTEHLDIGGGEGNEQ